jgi:hypothetical protein
MSQDIKFPSEFGRTPPTRHDLIPGAAIQRMAARLSVGQAQGKPDRGWIQREASMSERYGKALRHLVQWGVGMRDEDHLAAALVQLAILCDLEARVSNGELPCGVCDMAEAWIK